jgi:broad specificity phosphatase PhoE
MYEEPRLREQDFGNLQNPSAMAVCQEERERFGSFYYRFPQGESGADVYDRVSGFMETMHRRFTVRNTRADPHDIPCPSANLPVR